MAYATATGTRRNVAALRAVGWRYLVTPVRACLIEGMRYALDNGAWSAHVQGTPWDCDGFVRLLTRHGAGADFVVVPDIVGTGRASLQRSRAWLPLVLTQTRLALIPVQDGITPQKIAPFLGERVGIFVGGGTAWKLGTLGVWGNLAREAGCYLHVGRVNTARRIARCASVGAHSFDGTSASRYAVTVAPLDAARRQGGLRLYA
jgi:hypothetical protein